MYVKKKKKNHSYSKWKCPIEMIDFVYFFVFQVKLEEWKIIFFIAAAFYFSGNLIFVIIGKAEIQPWNEAVDDVIKVPAEHVGAKLGTVHHMEFV